MKTWTERGSNHKVLETVKTKRARIINITKRHFKFVLHNEEKGSEKMMLIGNLDKENNV